MEIGKLYLLSTILLSSFLSLTAQERQNVATRLNYSPLASLQGAASGVQVINSTQLGGEPTLRIRGIGSLSGTQPLYVVDGLICKDIRFLSSDDISSITVLKDGALLAQYGVQGSNGVVVIATKSGEEFTSCHINYSGYVGFNTVINPLEMADTYYYRAIEAKKGASGNISALKKSAELFGGDIQNYNPSTSTSWYDELLQNGFVQNHNFSIGGSDKKLSYLLSIGYYSEESVMSFDQSLERIKLHSKLDAKPLDWFKVGANIFLSSQNSTIAQSPWSAAYQAAPILPAYNPNNNYAYPLKYSSFNEIGMSDFYLNPLAIADYSTFENSDIRIVPTIWGEINIWGEKLKFKTLLGEDFTMNRTTSNLEEHYVSSNQFLEKPEVQEQTNTFKNWSFDNKLSYNQSVKNHDITFDLGISKRSEQSPLMLINSSVKRLALYGLGSYSYDDKFGGSIYFRRESSSLFDDGWCNYPSVSAWYDIASAFKTSKVNSLKIYSSWGRSGNENFYYSANLCDANNLGVFGDLDNNTPLSCETSETFDLGLGAVLFSQRLSLNLDYYNRKSHNVIHSSVSSLQNGASITNSGLEFNGAWCADLSDYFGYQIGMNLTVQNNKFNGEDSVISSSGIFHTALMQGNSINSFYGYQLAGVYQSQREIAVDEIAKRNNLQPGDFRYVDQNGDGEIDMGDCVVLGNALPSFICGFNVGFHLHNFQFSALLYGEYGGEVVNSKRAARIENPDMNYDLEWIRESWRGEGYTNDYMSPEGSVKEWNIARFNSWYVEDNSFFRVENIEVAYNFRPKDRAKAPSFRLGIAAERPYTWFKSGGFTPENCSGFDGVATPLPSSFAFTFRVCY